MPVLVEAISVIVRHDSIEAKVAGGFKAFTDLCRAETTTLCSDGELARVGFGATDAARRFVEKLGFLGLVHLSKGSATDLVMADQRSGLLQPCTWAEFAVVDLPGSPPPRVAACRLKGGKVSGLTVPDGWRYDSSVSREAGVIPKRDAKTLAVYAGRPGGAAPIAQRLGLKPVKS